MMRPLANRAGRAACLILLLFSLLFSPVRAAEDATYTVNSRNDANDGSCSAAHCSLREAIQAANSNHTADIIRFSTTLTITLSSALPTVLSTGGALTIDGASQDIRISGNHGDERIFQIGDSANVTLQNLSMKYGNAGLGGAIYNQGTLTLNDCFLGGNNAANYGGAIYTMGTLNLNHTDFSENYALYGSGGAVYINKGATNITGGRFSENGAAVSGGAIFNRYESEYQGGDLTIAGTTFHSNTASGDSGGAIASESNVTVDDATFSQNSAQQNGGAFYNDRGGKYQIHRSTFSLNQTTYDNGGAIYADNAAGTSFIYDSSFGFNYAHGHGGAFYIYQGGAVFARSQFGYNQAVGHGGGGYNADGHVTLTDDTFESNIAGQGGGGFYNNENMTISRSTFTGNSAGENGGGINHASDVNNVVVKNSTFYGNRAVQGGGILAHGPIVVINCTFNANRADEGAAITAAVNTYLYNTIVAGSISSGNCSGSEYIDHGNNIDSGATCHFSPLKGSMSNTDPQLGSLKMNGGATETMLPQDDSPAYDAVIYNAPNRCPEDDQRGYPRPSGAFCDIGAVERYYHTLLPLVIRQ